MYIVLLSAGERTETQRSRAARLLSDPRVSIVIVAGTDSHTALSINEEFNFTGPHNVFDDTPKKRIDAGINSTGAAPVALSSAGSTGVWTGSLPAFAGASPTSAGSLRPLHLAVSCSEPLMPDGAGARPKAPPRSRMRQSRTSGSDGGPGPSHGRVYPTAMPDQKQPGPDARFDVVLCQQAITFITDRERAIREMKPGGRVGLNVSRTGGFVPAFAYLTRPSTCATRGSCAGGPGGAHARDGDARGGGNEPGSVHTQCASGSSRIRAEKSGALSAACAIFEMKCCRRRSA